MKKVFLMFGLMIILMSGCGNNKETYNNAIQSGLDSLAAEEYEKAEVHFEMAVEEGVDDGKAENLLKQTVNYRKAKSALEKEDLPSSEELANLVINQENGSEALIMKAEIILSEIEEVKAVLKKLESTYKEAESYLEEENYEKASEAINFIINDEKIETKPFEELKLNSIELKELIETKQQEIADAESQEQLEKEKNIAEMNDSEEVDNSNEDLSLEEYVEEYRAQEWYGYGEDPEFTFDQALSTITNVLGPEDDTFFYNGRMEVSIDDQGRRYYGIWKEDSNASNSAEGTIAYYYVFDDGTVEQYE
ncbi:hypothetical protein EAC14_11890 [Enterococcus faecium]|nr:hypothetical protein [Enterococcus faecium]